MSRAAVFPMSVKSATDTEVVGIDEDKVKLKQVLKDTHAPLRERDVDYDSDTPPTPEEWKTMKGYGSFITHDEADVEHMFHVNDIIYVLPTGRDPEDDVDRTELWLAQIKSIRAHDSDSVWIKVKWFYHPKELPKNAKGAKGTANQFGEFERIDSNQADFIPTSTCCGIAKITAYDEQTFEQEDIEPGSFYYRCEYDWQKRVLKNLSPPCSICKKGYNPDTDVMHFCPRLGCRRSWHAPCLVKANWLINSEEDFPQRMESLDRSFTPADAPKGSPQKKARPTKPEDDVLSDRYGQMPAELLAIARQPIVRGGALGLVGNVRSVVRARTMVQKALNGTEDIPENWQQLLGNVYDASKIGPAVETKGRRPVFAYQCPRCGEPI